MQIVSITFTIDKKRCFNFSRFILTLGRLVHLRRLEYFQLYGKLAVHLFKQTRECLNAELGNYSTT